MSDTRPSENQDDRLELPEMRRRGFFDDVPTGADFLAEPALEPEQAEIQWPEYGVQTGLGWETADAQHIVAAIDRLTEQQRLANLIAWTDRDGYRPTAAVQAQIEKGLGL